MRFFPALVAAALAFGVLAALSVSPTSAAGVNCSDFANQAAAQTWFLGHGGPTSDPEGLDGDHNGIACQSLPCPCNHSTTPETSVPQTTKTTSTQQTTAGSWTTSNGDPDKCTRPKSVQNITFSKTKYPRIRQHFLKALRKGWPRTLVLNRASADARRARLLTGIPTRHGYDRDEYPPAVGRGKGNGLEKGTNPTGWKADVAYVPSSENRSHGSTMGTKLRRLCSGTRFRYVFY